MELSSAYIIVQGSLFYEHVRVINKNIEQQRA